MSIENRIEQQKLLTGSNIVNLCACCGRQAWSDYYGNFACKTCIEFFITCIRERKACECQRRDDLCQISNDPQSRCNFCYLQRIYNAGLKPKMYGRHENGWYMKDIIPSLIKIPAQHLNLSLDRHKKENNMMKTFHFGLLLYFRFWLIRHWPFVDLSRMPRVIASGMTFRGKLMGAVANSFHAHDVLKCGYQYFDPYKCCVMEHQNFSTTCIYTIRHFLNCSEDGIPTVKQESDFVFRSVLPPSS
ncbi:uncharacterized protein LOC111622672 [Centruroides sculpturatus]|uniref:uncharacterized protein LOC111622672 n=1 Tax=Centruroides sculpturatus TaxID=218467 RepID=UPI000C6EC2CE|nr:uncharacterized protein LOC111622672 [Centruroides sculpturatus]